MKSTAPANFDGDQFFVLVLSGGGAQGQSIQYASCVKGWIQLPGKAGSLNVPVCYCLISEMPFIPFFKAMLVRLLGTWKQTSRSWMKWIIVNSEQLYFRRCLDYHRRDLKLEKNLSSLSSILSNHVGNPR